VNKKIILHLCADTGSDTQPYQDNDEYDVILVGQAIGVENFSLATWLHYHGLDKQIYGIIANPVCLEFSTARTSGKARDPEAGMFLVKECQRIIAEAKSLGGLKFWVIENPAKGVLKDFLGKPEYAYEPWWYGSPWTKKTALWGEFNIPERLYTDWEKVPKIKELYTRPTRSKPSLAFMHKSHKRFIREFDVFEDVDSDMEFRSLCSQKFAQAFYEANR
jgi:site-specific DNA-cytosine methylase